MTATDPAGHAEDIIGRMLHDIGDAATRYRVADLLKARLAWVQALSAAQLVQEGVSLTDAADRLGVSRQYLDRLLRDTGLPGPRTPAPEDHPAWRWGEWLAVVRLIAQAHDHGRRATTAQEEMDTLEYRGALAAPTMRDRIQQSAERWLRRIDADRREDLRAMLSDAAAALASDMPARWTIGEQADAVLAYYRRCHTAEASAT